MGSSTHFKVTTGLLALALAIGGTGVSFPRLSMLLQICSLGVAAYVVVSQRDWRLPRTSVLALAVLGAVLVLPLLQLIPLAPNLWRALPGREVPAELDTILGWSRWRPVSLDIEATLKSLLRLLPSAVLFLCCLFLPKTERLRLLWVVLAFALLSAVLGVAQLTTGGALTPYHSSHTGYPVGLFVNRNHNAALLLVAVPLAAALGASEIARRKVRTAPVAACSAAIILFALVIVGTTSRMALLLLPVALAGALLLLFYRHSVSRVILPSILLIGAAGTFLFIRGALDRTLARFSWTEPRFDYWTDIEWALQHYGLAGTGFGTFIPVYKSAESLEAVVPAYTNHAHNDYLEVLLEGGIAAAAILLAFAALVAFLLFWRSRRGDMSLGPLINGAAIAGISLLLLFSAVDYPLRTSALACVFALLCALLLPSKDQIAADQAGGQGLKARSIAVGAALAVVTGTAVLVIQAGLSAHLIATGRYDAALRVAPWSTEAHERQATAKLGAGALPEAWQESLSALRLSPISVSGIRTAGLIRLFRDDAGNGNRLMQLAVTLGWRDPLAQLWAIDVAIASNEPEKALQRAQALFQQNLMTPPVVDRLLFGFHDDRMYRLLARTLEARPVWRTQFLRAAGRVSAGNAAPLVRVLTLLESSKAPASIIEAQPLLDALVASGRIAEAQRLWLLLHPHALISNGGFEETVGTISGDAPVDWDITGDNHDHVTVTEPPFAPRSRALHIASSEGSRIMSQTLMLPPGAYTLTYTARVEEGGLGRFRWELLCRSSEARQVKDAFVEPAAAWRKMAIVFDVPDQDCPIQRLAIRRLDDTGPAQLWLDDVRLNRTAR